MDAILARCKRECLPVLDLSLSGLDDRLGVQGMRTLVRSLKSLTSVKELHLHGHGIGPKGMSILSGAAGSFSRLQTLGLNGCDLGDAGLASLGEFVARLPELEVLCLRGNAISGDGLAILGDGLRQARSFATLDLGDNRLGDVGSAQLAAIAPSTTSLKRLLISENDIRMWGIAALTDQTQVWSQLEVLDLSDNDLGDSGAQALAAADWRSLRDINLALNQIANTGAISIADSAARWPRLRSLNIAANLIEDAGLRALIAALRREPWKSSLEKFVTQQNECTSLPPEVEWSGDADVWREYGDRLPPTVLSLRVVSRTSRSRKRLPTDVSKSLLAVLDTCLDWPERSVSERKIHRSALLKAKRRELGLDELISQTSVHNHLMALARLCGMESLVEVQNKRQSSQFRQEALKKLAVLRRDVAARIKDQELRD